MRRTYYRSCGVLDGIAIFAFKNGQYKTKFITVTPLGRKGTIGIFKWSKADVIGHPFYGWQISRDEARHLLGKHFANIP
jgi:hypothetical protein